MSALTMKVAEHVFGWKWWAHQWHNRIDNGPVVDMPVARSFRPPDFPNARWAKWGEESGLRPADGSEPIAGCWGTGDAMSMHQPEPYAESMDAALLVVAELRKHFSRVELHSVEDTWICQVESDSGLTTERYVADAEAKTPARAVCKAALKAMKTLAETEPPA